MKNCPLEFYFLAVSGANSSLCWGSNLLHIEMIKFGAHQIFHTPPPGLFLPKLSVGIGLQFVWLKNVKNLPPKKLGSFEETSGATSVMSVNVSPTDSSCFPSPLPASSIRFWTNTFLYYEDKYNLQYEQIKFSIWTNTVACFLPASSG